MCLMTLTIAAAPRRRRNDESYAQLCQTPGSDMLNRVSELLKTNRLGPRYSPPEHENVYDFHVIFTLYHFLHLCPAALIACIKQACNQFGAAAFPTVAFGVRRHSIHTLGVKSKKQASGV